MYSYLCAQFNTATGIVVNRQISDDGSVVLLRLPYPAYSGYQWIPTGEVIDLRLFDESVQGLVPSYLSEDGKSILGYYIRSDGNPEAFRWQKEFGLEGLGDLPQGRFESDAYGCTPDGSVIFGSGRIAAGKRAMRWFDGVMIDLVASNPLLEHSSAMDCSHDGKVIVGSAFTYGEVLSYIWEDNGGEGVVTALERLPDSTGALTRVNSPLACSPDGTEVVGYGYHKDHGLYYGPNSIWNYTYHDGFTEFLFPIDDGVGLPARFVSDTYVSDDLSCIVAKFEDGGIYRLLRWRKGVGTDVLEFKGKSYTAWQATEDGNIVAGSMIGLDDVSRAVLWDQHGNMHFLSNLLDSTGVDTGEAELLTATAISSDGRSIAGQLPLDNLGKPVAYHAVLSDLWSFDEHLGDGWKVSRWYGEYFTAPGAIIWHDEHAWQEYFTKDFISVYFYDYHLGSWLWTSRDIYPFFKVIGSGGDWVYYYEGTSNPREYWSLKSESVMSEDDLIPPP
jgi:uncharacterized membrane protein